MSKFRSDWKLHICFAVLGLSIIGLVARLAFLHLGRHDKILAGVKKNHNLEKTLIAGRGHILDCKGHSNPLAMNQSVKDVCVDPKVIVESNKVAEVTSILAQSLGLEQSEVFAKVNQKDRRFAVIAKRIPEDQAELIKKKKVPGVFFQDDSVRYYPQGHLMCHILGFVNNEDVGSAGVELTCNKYLKGETGVLETKVNALRQELYLQRSRYVEATDGNDVVLTVDQNIQYMVEKALDEAMEQHHAKGAWSIVQRVKTGEIMAMASRPAYDLNKFSLADKDELLNRPIGYTYEPGSTMKAITFAAAFNERVVSQSQMFDCENGAWSYAGKILHDYHPYGMLSVPDGLKKSSNIMTVKIALILGEKRLYTYMKAFGVGEKSGLDLPGEERGILWPVSKWAKISIGRIPIGQGVSVTALQMVGIYGTIANDGYRMKPYIVSEIRDKSGKVIYRGEPEVVARPISSEAAATMKTLLGRVTEDGGTGKKARVEGYVVAGKTGTAQKVINGQYSTAENIASFVGFLPAENPEFTMAFIVDEPQPLHTGGEVAAPAFGKVASQIARYLDIPTTEIKVAAASR